MRYMLGMYKYSGTGLTVEIIPGISRTKCYFSIFFTDLLFF